jgi:hypothetical protein
VEYDGGNIQRMVEAPVHANPRNTCAMETKFGCSRERVGNITFKQADFFYFGLLGYDTLVGG